MKKSSATSFAYLLVAFFIPLFTNAQAGSIDTTDLLGYKNSIISIINGMLVPVIIAIAFLVFIWGVYKYFILGAENESEKAEGRKFVMWGLIGFVVIFSVWGLVNFVGSTFGLSAGGSATDYGLTPPKL